MTTSRQKKWKSGFTLIELLVVIAIISILGALVLPQVTTALFKGKLIATAANGRSIHQSIFAYETESIYTTTKTAWPQQSDPYGTTSEYFKFLVTNNIMNVSYSFFAADGVPAAQDEDTFAGENCAWRMVRDVNDSTEETIPVLFTKNLDIGNLSETDASKLDSSLKPFGAKGLVFVTKSGATFSLFKDDLAPKAFGTLFNVTKKDGKAADNLVLPP